MRSQAERGAEFAALHTGPPFVIPNPWDTGSARMLKALGFRALATTSSGYAFTLGRPDGGATLDDVARHVTALTEATDLPVAADLENGYGRAPDDAARAIGTVAAAGGVGGSIEDYDPEAGLYDRSLAAERIAAAAEAAAGLGFPFVLAARAENHIRGVEDLDDTIERLRAYEAAGADVLYAPGLRTTEQIGAVAQAVAKPLNVLAFGNLTLAQIVDAGAQRVSVGGGLTWIAVDAAAEAARRIAEGDLSVLGAPGPPEDWLA